MNNQIVLAITGGGSAAISNMLSVGGASSYFLEGVVPYSNKSLDDFLGFTPDKYCSEKTARQMAFAAFKRGIKLGCQPEKSVGISCTASLVKPSGEREGRRHFAYISSAKYNNIVSYSFELLENRSRQEEESIVAEQIQLIAEDKGLHHKWTDEEKENFVFRGSHDRYDTTPMLYADRAMAKVIEPEGATFDSINYSLVMPGSFNPFHEGHANIVKAIHKKLGKHVFLEISITNVDKPPIDYIDINLRVNSITNALLRDKELEKAVGGIILSNTPKFIDKTWVYPLVDFVIGADTAKRVLDTKYGDYVSLFDSMRIKGSRFYVTPRNGYDVYVPLDFQRHFSFLTEDECPILDISSTQLRGQNDNNRN